MNYYNEIKNKLIDNEVYSKVKDYSRERHKVITYFEIGKLLNEAGGKYGDNIIDEYSKKLVIEVGKKYNRRTLFRMKQFYNMFKDEKVSPVATQLTWSHYSELLSIKDVNKLTYYINIAKNNNLSKRELRERIKSNEYERLPIETKNKLIDESRVEVKDFVPNPILIKNKNNTEIITEKALHHLILEDIESFMKEQGLITWNLEELTPKGEYTFNYYAKVIDESIVEYTGNSYITSNQVSKKVESENTIVNITNEINVLDTLSNSSFKSNVFKVMLILIIITIIYKFLKSTKILTK